MRRRSKEEIEEIVNDLGYFLLDEYKTDNNHHRRVFIQDEIGYKYDSLIGDLIRGHIPSIVDPKKSKISLENISLWLLREEKQFELCDGNKYMGNDKKLLFRCLETECNMIFDTTWDELYSSNRGCQYCSGKRVSNKNRLSLLYPNISEEWDYNSNEGNPEDFSYGSHEKKFWICPIGHPVYKASILDRTSKKSGCPDCSSPRGEDSISYLLTSWGFVCQEDFIPQAKFKDCRSIRILPFDFYLPKYNLCIEFHGGQHYFPVEFFGGEKAFKEQKKRDKIKVKYCRDNNIPLLVIPYWEFDNIEEILSKELNI